MPPDEDTDRSNYSRRTDTPTVINPGMYPHPFRNDISTF